jgi:acetyl-CoA carboxylase carboxyltransferase component
METLYSPLHGQVTLLMAEAGQTVGAGTCLVVVEAMKMEHEIVAPEGCVVQQVLVAPGDWVEEGGVLLHFTVSTSASAPKGEEPSAPRATEPSTPADQAKIRPDLQRVMDRHAFTLDAARPQAVDKRHAQGKLTARENIAQLCGNDFVEYGALAIAAQTQRRSVDDLVRATPADGMVVGVVSGRCFAGNAALLGCCDVVIATKDSNIGMGGPAMIEGGGLGVFAPEQIGPSPVQYANGVIDVLVADDAAALQAAHQYLAYFQGARPNWQAPETLALREVVPEKRARAYDTLKVVDALVDVGSVMPLRSGFGVGIHTLLARLEGRPVGVLVNNPLHLGGAIDADAADKAARFMQLCNAHGLPLISLVDTPGFMVGPDIEEQAQVRHVSRMFVAAAHLRVPLVSVVLRKAYGLGAMAMTGGGFHVPVATVAWPSAEFGAMGLEGAVRLGFKKELQAAASEAEREALFESLLAQQIEKGHALQMATTLEIDHVIDPAQTRSYLVNLLSATQVRPMAAGAMVDTW